MSATSQSSLERTSPIRRLIIPALAALVVFAILCALGIWQIERLHWKEALIAQVDARLHQAPVAAPPPAAWPTLDLDDLDFTPVTVSGAFIEGHEADLYATLSDPRGGPLGGVGWWIFAPFLTDAGWIVYVNRGFVPDANKNPATRLASEPHGRVTVTGLLRKPETPGMFQSNGNPTTNQWFARQPARFAAQAGLATDQLAPYSIDADATKNPGGMPQGGETLVVFPNNHLQYVFTWFGLALALVAVFIAWARGALKPKD